MTRDPYQIIKSRHLTEKSETLFRLQTATSNPSVSRCDKPKYVFIVDPQANKQEIASAVEKIYAERKVRVIKVNIVCLKPKKRRVRGRVGMTSARKKAIVTLESGDSIEEAQ